MAYSQIAECFAEYAIGTCFLLLRLFARVKMVGFWNLQLDDLFAVLAIIFFTLQTSIIYFLGLYGNNIGLNAQTAMQVPDEQVPRLELGSKLAFMNWIWYLCYIWCLKGVLLCLYNKLTKGTHRQHLIWAASGICIATWLACMLTHICICTPIPRNWRIKPYAGDNCTIRGPNYIVIATMNVISDILIMVIPIPLLIKLQVPLHRKLVLAVMFSSGIFIMICTVLRAYYSLESLSTLSIALGWANRECFVAAIVVSLPGIKPLFRNSRWIGSSRRYKGSNSYDTGPSSGFQTGLSKGGSAGNTKTYISSFAANNQPRNHHHHHGTDTNPRNLELDFVSPSGKRASTASREMILDHNPQPISESPRHEDFDEGDSGSSGNRSMAIHVTTEYTLERNTPSRGGSI